MTLLERIRRYLQAVEQGHAKLVRSLGLEPLQNKYLVRVADSWSGKRPLGESSAFKDFQREWSSDGILFSFGVQVAAALQDVAIAGELPSLVRYFTLAESLQGLTDDANASLADLVPVGLTTARQSILRAMTPRPNWSQSQLLPAERAPSEYCRQLGLVHDDALTGVGRAGLTFPDHMLVRWLLALEAEAASGNRDPWRMSREVMEGLLHKPYDWFSDDIDRFPWFSWEGVCRLESFGLARTEEGPDAGMQIDQFGYQLTQLGKTVLAEVTSPNPPAPLSLVRGLLADNDAKIVAGLGAAGATAAERLVEGEIARSISHLKHELRNKLTPAVGQLDLLADASAAWGHWDRESLHIARDSVRDALKFVDGMARTVAGMSANPEWFALGAAVRDGVRQGRNGNRSVKVGLAAELDEWDAYGRREDAVLIVANLVRNALQAGANTLRIDADDDGAGSGLCLRVSDDGAGVRAADKLRIFDKGYSGGQGSGEGLWLARQTAERRFAGTLTLEVAPDQDKGATFALRLPTDKVRHAEAGKENA